MIDERRKNDELRRALDCLYDHIEVPDSTESWKRVQARLARRKRLKRWNRRLGYVAAVFAGSLVLSLSMNMNTQGAYSFATLFKNVRDTVVEIFHERNEVTNTSNALTPPPPDDPEHSPNEHFRMREVSLEEALEKAPFMQVPTAVPDQFTLRRVRIYQSSADYVDHVSIDYSGPNGEMLSIKQHQITGVTDGLKTEMPLHAGEYKDVIVNDRPGILFIPTNGNIHLEWLTSDRVFIHIVGNITEDEMIATARSLSYKEQ